MEIEKNKYEIEMVLAGRPILLIAEITGVEFEASPEGEIEWLSTNVAMLTDCGHEIWEAIIKPEQLDLGRVTADSQLFDAIQEVAEAIYDEAIKV
jgi:hypothetical protein